MIDHIGDRGGCGVVAQLAERLNGIEKVRGSIPLDSTSPTERSQLGIDYITLPMRRTRSMGDACPTLAEAVRQVVSAKIRAGRRGVYITSLRQYYMLFIRGREWHLLSAVDHSSLESWFCTRNEAATSQASNMGRLSALFTYGVRRGWITFNPCHRLERVSIDPRPPRILTPHEASTLMQWVDSERPSCLAWFALTLCAGMRPEEAMKMTWSAVDLDAGTVRVDACASKVRQRRIVHLMPLAVSWLRRARARKALLPVSRSTIARARRDAVRGLRWGRWDQDLLRHTAASYLLAHHQDAGKVARELGNSAGILLRHYAELVSSEESSMFWSTTPA